jgi:hypothetical protein
MRWRVRCVLPRDWRHWAGPVWSAAERRAGSRPSFEIDQSRMDPSRYWSPGVRTTHPAASKASPAARTRIRTTDLSHQRRSRFTRASNAFKLRSSFFCSISLCSISLFVRSAFALKIRFLSKNQVYESGPGSVVSSGTHTNPHRFAPAHCLGEPARGLLVTGTGGKN